MTKSVHIITLSWSSFVGIFNLENLKRKMLCAKYVKLRPIVSMDSSPIIQYLHRYVRLGCFICWKEKNLDQLQSRQIISHSGREPIEPWPYQVPKCMRPMFGSRRCSDVTNLFPLCASQDTPLANSREINVHYHPLFFFP